MMVNRHEQSPYYPLFEQKTITHRVKLSGGYQILPYMSYTQTEPAPHDPKALEMSRQESVSYSTLSERTQLLIQLTQAETSFFDPFKQLILRDELNPDHRFPDHYRLWSIETQKNGSHVTTGRTAAVHLDWAFHNLYGKDNYSFKEVETCTPVADSFVVLPDDKNIDTYDQHLDISNTTLTLFRQPNVSANAFWVSGQVRRVTNFSDRLLLMPIQYYSITETQAV